MKFINRTFQEFSQRYASSSQLGNIPTPELRRQDNKNRQNSIADISESLKKIAGNDLTITSNIDPSIVGGFVAKVGDRLIDASVRTRLENMKRGLIKGT